MKKLLLVLAGVGLLTSCNDIDGMLSVTSPLLIKTKKEQVTLATGQYNAELDYDEGDRTIEFEIKNARGDKDLKSKFVVPAGRNLPRENGEFTLTALEIGQDFDFHGSIKTMYSRSQRYRTTESCSYQRPERVCYQRTDRYGRVYWDCHTVYRTYYGYRDVEYHDERTEREVEAAFAAPGSDQTLAQFAGQRTDTERVYDYTGVCR
ncbi:MAG: hypothetical protein AB7F59_11985 [Bdellovibrionales bacterium]